MQDINGYMALQTALTSAAEAHVRKQMELLPKDYTYHTPEHTAEVVRVVVEIGNHLGIAPTDMESLIVASWFHDLGYIETYEEHEEASKKMAESFLKEHEISDEQITQIKALIDATRYEQEPQNTLEEIIKDGDLSNLAQPNALKSSLNIRHEWEVFRNIYMSDKKWNKTNLAFFESHAYYTPYGQEVLAKRKKENIKKLKKRLKNKGDGLTEELEAELKSKKKELKKLSQKYTELKEQKPDRGIETMFRSTYRVHISLSSIADNKANILLSVNAILISIIISQFGKFSNTYIIISIFIMLLVCLSTIVFAILSTRPKVNSGIFTREDILQKRTNLLFFGNFHRMDLGEYKWGINEMMKDSDYLYGSMATDIYFLGKVLAKKFRLLRIAYNIFMYGIIASVIAFGVSYLLSL